jgi:hypothetical protein
MQCAFCQDHRWVCERTRKAVIFGEHACTWSGAGMPCPSPKQSYLGGCSPGEVSHSLIRRAVSAWRALLSTASRSGPGGNAVGLLVQRFGQISKPVRESVNSFEAATLHHPELHGIQPARAIQRGSIPRVPVASELGDAYDLVE